MTEGSDKMRENNPSRYYLGPRLGNSRPSNRAEKAIEKRGLRDGRAAKIHHGFLGETGWGVGPSFQNCQKEETFKKPGRDAKIINI